MHKNPFCHGTNVLGHFNNDKCEGGKLRKEKHAIATGKVEILDGVAGEGL